MSSGDLAGRRARLSDEQRAALEARLRGGRTPAHGISPRRAEVGPAALSFAQQRLWFLAQLEPTSTAYHLCGGLSLRGTLDVAALRRAIDALVSRHEALRTVFRTRDDGSAEQVVQRTLAIELPCVDLSTTAAAARADAIGEQLERMRATPFDLAVGPLLRMTLLRTEPDSHQLLVVMHHIISDAWSVQIMLEELAQHYRASLEQRAAALPALPIQYGDYARWQRQWLEGEEGSRQLTYWREQLADARSPLLLRTDHPRRPDAQYQAGQYSFELPPELLLALRREASEQGSTLFTLLLTALKALLFRYTGQSDIRVGVPFANRNRAETAHLIGFFINTHVLRAHVEGQSSLRALALRVSEAAFSAQTHQDLPFDRLVEVLQPDRSLGQTPLFQVAYNHFRRDHGSLTGWPRLSLERLDFADRNALFELMLETIEREDGNVSATLRYAQELFERATIERMAGHYTALLRALVERPQQSVGEVVLASPDEAAQLREWGELRQSFAEVALIPRQIERWARETPDAIAVVLDGMQLSYGQLNRQANQLAHGLIAQGAGPEVRVGVALTRSVELVVALLAVLKAGAAYVPLDPEYPAERLGWMLEDSEIKLLVAHSQLRDRLQAARELPTLELDQLDLRAQPEHDPTVDLHADNLAYVIFTSGSTGRPKGSQITHRNLARLFAATDDWFHFDRRDVWTFFHSYAFDFSVWEIFGALRTGAKLVIVPYWVSRSPDDLLRLLRAEGVTVLSQTPSAFTHLVQAEEQDPEGELALRVVVFGGEALDPERLRGWIERHGDERPRLINMYGITETTVHVTYRPITRVDLEQQRSPLGAAMPDLGLRVLDARLCPVPIGVAGELYVAGEGLARGYGLRPTLTATRFVADPFSEEGRRLYRTGDQVRFRADGELEYLGRVDQQVKIRGFRIELGEVEAQLLALPDVTGAVVLPSSDGARLVAYASLCTGSSVDSAELRKQLKQTLPEYMVPGEVVLLAALPLNANGKVDRKALPEPGLEPRAYAPPEGELERALANIWAEVLGVQRVGRDDNFFELGGHSLLAVQLVARIQAKLQHRVTVRDVLLAGNVRELAAAVQAEDPPAAERALSALEDFMDGLESAS